MNSAAKRQILLGPGLSAPGGSKMNRLLIQLLIVLFFGFPCPVQSASDWFEKGISYMGAQQYPKAIVAFSKAIAEDPDRVETYNNRGMAWCKNGDYDLAMADFNKAMEIDPRNAEIFNNRGTIWFYKGQFDRAISDYDKALGIDPDFAKAYTNRGAAWFCKGNFDLALLDYNKALEIDPDNVEINRQRAWILSNTSEQARKHKIEARTKAKKRQAIQPKISPPLKPGVPQLKSAPHIPQPATPHPETTDQPPESTSQPIYSVQVGAFSSQQNATNLARRMKEKGYEARVTPFRSWSKNVLYTVRIGKYTHLETAKKKAEEVTAKENIPATVRPANEL